MSVSVVRRVLDRYGTEGKKEGKDGVRDEAGMRMRRGLSMFTKLTTRLWGILYVKSVFILYSVFLPL